MLYRRCAADSTTDANYMYRAGCVDISKFGEQWDFSNNFSRKVDVAMKSPSKNSEEAWFSIIDSETFPGSTRNFTFPCSDHSPLLSHFRSYIVPGYFWGYRSEQSPYLRVARRLAKKGFVLAFDGYFDFQKDEPSIGGAVGKAGTIEINVHLPRFDYLSGHLKNYF